MPNFQNQPLVETREYPIHADHGTACMLVKEDKGIFLEFKVFDNRSEGKSKILRLCLTDFFKQSWDYLSKGERDQIKPNIVEIIS